MVIYLPETQELSPPSVPGQEEDVEILRRTVRKRQNELIHRPSCVDVYLAYGYRDIV